MRKPGQHWLLFGADDPYTFNVFDSYGLVLLQAYDNPWFRNLARAFRTLNQNPYPYQSVTTNVCGHYCIYVAVQRALSGRYSFGDLPELTPHCFCRNDTVVAHRVRTDLTLPDILPDTRAPNQRCYSRTHHHLSECINTCKPPLIKYKKRFCNGANTTCGFAFSPPRPHHRMRSLQQRQNDPRYQFTECCLFS